MPCSPCLASSPNVPIPQIPAQNRWFSSSFARFPLRSIATELSSDFATEITGFTGEVVVTAISNGGEDLGISRAFLMALSENFPPILPSDAEKLITMFMDQFAASGPVVQSPVTPRRIAANSETSSAQSSPLNGNHYQANESSSPRNEASNVTGSSGSVSSRGSVMVNGSSIVWKSGVDQLGLTLVQ
ncbi:hypothetical protein Pyn_28657 [Prunus yedoensis var. nudiflora]|uniref:Uncharacterized protein n=1 Tax=Prunus yedoensis var. nudiflora TaxID=2094558 RepID=A0A314UMT3_PRUYE|nr:hypothetical protein Pyn_28657 [Prunus yedoensis var. nudiflora]